MAAKAYPDPTFSYDLRGRVAIVTGAAGAIGSGICRGLLQANCRVAVTDLAGERLDNLVSELAQGVRRQSDGRSNGCHRRRFGRIHHSPQ